MFRFLGRVGEYVVQWRAKDAEHERHIRLGNGGRVELRCVYRNDPVLAPVELFISPQAAGVLLELDVDGHVRATFSTGEAVRVPCPVPKTK